MPCYLISAGNTGMVKIGWADSDVEARRRDLQTAHWEVLTVVRTIDGPFWIERAMHDRFAEHRVLNEWFRFVPDMMTVSATDLSPVLIDHAHAPIIAAFGGTRPLAEAISVEPRLAIHWHRRGIPAKYWYRVVKCAAVLNPPLKITSYDLDSSPERTAA